jgi:hypothetical protein
MYFRVRISILALKIKFDLLEAAGGQPKLDLEEKC